MIVRLYVIGNHPVVDYNTHRIVWHTGSLDRKEHLKSSQRDHDVYFTHKILTLCCEPLDTHYVIDCTGNIKVWKKCPNNATTSGVSQKKQQGAYYACMGGAVYVLCLLNTLVFCTSVVFFKASPNFDPVWAKEGFCVSNPTMWHWNSHHLCLYTDVILAILFVVLYYFLHNSDGVMEANKFVFFNIFGVIAHSLGHAGLADALLDDKNQNFGDDCSYMSTIHTKESLSIVMKEKKIPRM